MCTDGYSRCVRTLVLWIDVGCVHNTVTCINADSARTSFNRAAAWVCQVLRNCPQVPESFISAGIAHSWSHLYTIGCVRTLGCDPKEILEQDERLPEWHDLGVAHRAIATDGTELARPARGVVLYNSILNRFDETFSVALPQRMGVTMVARAAGRSS
jgi:hypothetical protein